MLQGNTILPLAEVILRVTVTQVLYECQVNENLIIQMLRSRCHCTENEAVNLYVYEKTTRAPIRALQSYLEAEKGFPPDSKKSVYGLAFDKMSSEPDCRNVTPGGVLCPLRPGVRGLESGPLLPRHADGDGIGCCDGDLKHKETSDFSEVLLLSTWNQPNAMARACSGGIFPAIRRS